MDIRDQALSAEALAKAGIRNQSIYSPFEEVPIAPDSS